MDKKGYILQDLEWDTEFFDVECARISIKVDLSISQYGILQEDIMGYKFITIDNEIGSYRNNMLLCQLNNCYLVDVPATYRLSNLPNYSEKTNSFIINNNVGFDNRLLRIGQNAFSFGRFYNDERISKEKAAQLYVSWLKNSFNREDKYFVIADSYKGFILFSETNDNFGLDIELIAVDETERGRGIGKQMLSALNSYAREHEYKYINVVTQADNIVAMNFYSGQGYKLDNCMYTFHCWR